MAKVTVRDSRTGEIRELTKDKAICEVNSGRAMPVATPKVEKAIIKNTRKEIR